MPLKLDWNELREACRVPLDSLTPFDAVGLARRFGRLARWCLRREVLDLAAGDDAMPERIRASWRELPALPTTHGSCWVIFATDDASAVPLLRPAFVLPLRWVAGESHSSALPHGLADFAESVLHSLGEVLELAEARYGLRLHDDLGELDLGNVPLRYESGWAALAAGLLVLATRGRPNTGVWASAIWDNGLRRVDGLENKLPVAAEFGARVMFVPTSCVDAARQLAPSLEIIGLPENEPSPRKALRPYLQPLNVPPERSDPAADRVQWYLSQTEADAAQRYYRDNLLPDISDACRSLLTELGHDRAGVLITIASDNPELVPLGVEIFQPARCLVLYTTDYADRTATARELARARADKLGCDLFERGFSNIEVLREDMGAAIREFIGDTPPSQVVFDLTPGPKDISFSWMLEIAAPGSRLHYLRHRRSGWKVVPFTERPRVFIAGGGDGTTRERAPGAEAYA